MAGIYFYNLVNKSILYGRGRYEAASKATLDIKDIVLSFPDVNYCPIIRHFENKIIGAIELVTQLCIRLLFLPKGSLVFIQYPMVNINAFYLLRKLLAQHKVIVIIHDLQSYRYSRFYNERNKELAILNSMHCIIVHSNEMKKLLVEDGVDKQIIVLRMFDYLLPESQSIRYEDKSIVFAGALQKSRFINDLFKVNITPYHFNLYGGVKPDIKKWNNIEYKGAFSPNDISIIEGEWGLMWDGDGIDSCIGNFGEYLRIIAPHKFSLYIACGLKLIIWEKSAMANVVLNHKIGITISNLNEITKKISQLTDDDISQMTNNVKLLSVELRNGNMFSNAFQKALAYCTT